jgi:hypothetical protein
LDGGVPHPAPWLVAVPGATHPHFIPHGPRPAPGHPHSDLRLATRSGSGQHRHPRPTAPATDLADLRPRPGTRAVRSVRSAQCAVRSAQTAGNTEGHTNQQPATQQPATRGQRRGGGGVQKNAKGLQERRFMPYAQGLVYLIYVICHAPRSPSPALLLFCVFVCYVL